MMKPKHRYEYKFSGVLRFTDDEIIDSLNKLGKDGWEVIDIRNGNFLLKREIDNSPVRKK